MNTLEMIVVGILVVSFLGTLALWKRDKAALYAIFSLSLVALFGITTWQDMTPEWKGYQREYAKLLMEKAKTQQEKEDAANFPIEIRQIWNDELKIADRCTSCHLGTENPDMADAPEPFRYHPAAHVDEQGAIYHDFNKIGCTICHQGQGRATDVVNSHAVHIHHWEFPMYPVGEKSMVQASCAQCHEGLTKPEGYEILKGAEMIMDARDFAAGQNDLEIECTACHTIYGIGEVVAPDLGEYGARTEHEFEGTHNMDHVEGHKDMYNWTYQHFLEPKKISPADPAHGQEETIMPEFGMSEEMAHKLTTWVYSMKESNIPVKYRYRPDAETLEAKRGALQQEIAGLYTPEEYAQLSEGEKLFLKYNCWVCHTVKGKGGKLAPDLTKVGTRRTDDWMLKHFKDPRSVTQKSFMPQFNLSQVQMDELTAYLKTLQ
ncbi:MAG: c-type cytochrome [Nitrospinae bacterium]|nr:c-type cytochrome [Nitrospinota bacterium]